MKALSVRQPWANLIASGKKTIETRTWKTSYRGKILIVSSLKPNIQPASYAIAVVELIDCRPMLKIDEEAACCTVYPRAFSWVFSNTQQISPFRVRGHLGLYDVQCRNKVSFD